MYKNRKGPDIVMSDLFFSKTNNIYRGKTYMLMQIWEGSPYCEIQKKRKITFQK